MEGSSEIVGLVEQASRAEVSLDALTDLVDEAEEALRSNDAERRSERWTKLKGVATIS